MPEYLIEVENFLKQRKVFTDKMNYFRDLKSWQQLNKATDEFEEFLSSLPNKAINTTNFTVLLNEKDAHFLMKKGKSK